MPPPVPASRSYAQLCGIATALDVVGDRWALLVVRDLLLGPMRFGELADGLPGIGTNTLAERLKQLEAAGVISRQPLPMPDRGVAYQLTEYGRELGPILMALGRWGAKSMARLPADVASRSRWLVAAMLAFRRGDDQARGEDDGVRGEASQAHREDDRARGRDDLAPPLTWELRLSDGPFTVRAAGNALTIVAGAPDRADAVISTNDTHLHQLLTGQVTPAEAIRAGTVTLIGERSMLDRLIGLFDFPAPAAPPGHGLSGHEAARA
jgi:DNA-binding HxlR family transcriptional regulator/putative sterol carrier protein